MQDLSCMKIVTAGAFRRESATVDAGKTVPEEIDEMKNSCGDNSWSSSILTRTWLKWTYLSIRWSFSLLIGKMYEDVCDSLLWFCDKFLKF